MPQSHPSYSWLEVHKDSLAHAYVVKGPQAEVVSLGNLVTRQGAIDQLIRRLHSKSPHLVLVSAARP
jgi:hypothetical protein